MTPRRRRRVRKRRLAALLGVLFVLSVPGVHVRPRASGRERDPVSRSRRRRARTSTPSCTRPTDSGCWPSARRRGPSLGRRPRTSRRSCDRQSSRSRTSASTTTTASIFAGWQVRSGRTYASQSIVEGGSTITQQFVKNAYIRNEQTLARKVREAALAWQLEQRWSKDRILTAYLNTIYFGNGAYGIQQALADVLRQGREIPRTARGRVARGNSG